MSMRSIASELDKVASAVEPESRTIAYGLDRIADLLETVDASAAVENLLQKATPDRSFSTKDLKDVTDEDIAQAKALLEGKRPTVDAAINPKALMLAIALLAAGFTTADAASVEKVIKMPTIEVKGKAPTVQLKLQKSFPNLFAMRDD